MTKRVHPAESARKLVGVASGVALVGIVTGFQVSANAEEASVSPAATSTQAPVAVDPATGQPVAPVTETAPEAVPAPADVSQPVAPVQPAAPVAPVEAPAVVAPVEVAPPAPAPAPAAPVNGTTAGSGG